MSASATEGTRLVALLAMAIPLYKAAQRQCDRAGPGAPPVYHDWQMAVLIMVAVMHRRKSKSAQYRYLYERRRWLMRRLGMDAFPGRSTYFERYRRAYTIFERAVVLQGRQALAEGVGDPVAVAVDKSLVPARGPVQPSRRGRRYRRRRGADPQAGWGYSEHHGWVYGYSYEVVVSASRAGVIMPLIISSGPANVSEAKSFPPKVALLPRPTRYILADAGYDTNANGELVEYTPPGDPPDAVWSARYSPGPASHRSDSIHIGVDANNCGADGLTGWRFFKARAGAGCMPVVARPSSRSTNGSKPSST